MTYITYTCRQTHTQENNFIVFALCKKKITKQEPNEQTTDFTSIQKLFRFCFLLRYSAINNDELLFFYAILWMEGIEQRNE